MTTTDHIAVNGSAAVSITLHVPSVGAWWADCVMENDADVSGDANVEIGSSLTLAGTVQPARAGVFALQRIVRVVAGAAGWGAQLASHAYHNDGPGGVQALRVATDAAQDAGEQLGAFQPEIQSVGKDYVREAGTAARTLEDVIGSTSWWVGYDGVTVVGTRTTQPATDGTYTLLAYDPKNRIATLAMDDLVSIGIGSILAAEERMPVAQTVRELRVEVSGNDAVVYATCGDADVRSRLVQVMNAFARRGNDGKIPYPVEYRVIRRNGDRLELQAVTRGLPDIGPISMAPGLAGAHSDIVEGAVLIVQFINGDRRRPMVTGFAGKDGTGPQPLNTTIDIATLLKLGANAANFVALANLVKARIDTIQQAFDGHTHVGTATISTGPVGTIAPVASPIGPLPDVAASKVKAE